ncbi:MAG: penicillin-binding protein 1C, partial [Bacteroidia bacterium]|nr:penicillin-binding protein 1C [Bacteroidia bacterium]
MILDSKIVTFIKQHKIKFVVTIILLAWFLLSLPSPLFKVPYSAVLHDRNHELLAAQIATDGQWRFPQSDSVPYKFRTCLLAFEDEYFYKHPGINPVSLYKSFVSNLKTSGTRRGGSTLTMQVARMSRGNQSRNYYQKMVEMLMALRIELSYSKKSILNLYCSNAPFGGNVVGLAAASWRYFGRAPEKLSWSEAAVLAVLPNAPSLIYPGKNQIKLLEKRNRLLLKLKDNKIIDSSTYVLAVLEPLPQKPYPIPQLAPHLLAHCVQTNKTNSAYESNIDKSIQLRVNELLNRHVRDLAPNQIYNACALVVETQTGKVVAYVGNSFSEKNEHDNYVDIIQAPRSTGSILKPFLYAFMLHENKILPASLLQDIPLRLGSYGPKNFNLTYDGLVPAHQAIARSLNVPAVKLLQEYSAAKFHQRLKQLGFTTFTKATTHYGLSLILGGGEAKLAEIAAAYSAMGRALYYYSNSRDRYMPGSYRPLTYLQTKETEKKGLILKSDLLNAGAIYYTFNAMTELLRPQDYTGWGRFLSKTKIAWKTGTSFGFRDAWAVGLNPKYTVAVWVGNADGEGRPDLTGTGAAAPLMFAIFNTLGRERWFKRPDNDLERIKVCLQSGYKASDICDQTAFREYPRGAEKTKNCPYHRLVHLDASGKYRVNSECYPVTNMQHKAWFVPSPVEEYFYKQHHLDYKPLPPYLEGCANELSHRQMEIVYPRDGFSIYVPVVESGEQSRCILKATHKNPNATLFWHLD